MLAADVPDLQVQVGKSNRGDILPDRGHGFEIGMKVYRVRGFDLFEEGGFAGVIEAEEEDGVFWMRCELSLELRWGLRRANLL
jgi:hypothetical protein